MTLPLERFHEGVPVPPAHHGVDDGVDHGVKVLERPGDIEEDRSLRRGHDGRRPGENGDGFEERRELEESETDEVRDAVHDKHPYRLRTQDGVGLADATTGISPHHRRVESADDPYVEVDVDGERYEKRKSLNDVAVRPSPWHNFDYDENGFGPVGIFLVFWP